jgi:hypothetical protein
MRTAHALIVWWEIPWARFFHPNRVERDADSILMSTVTKPVVSQLISGGSAANADELGDAVAAAGAADVGIDTMIESAGTGGWDAYEVWRRFIKDARDRRKQQETN